MDILKYITVLFKDEYGESDYEQAEYWYHKSAKLGNPSAQYKLGLLYETINRDHNKAKYWYAKAAKQGYANAYNTLLINNIRNIDSEIQQSNNFGNYYKNIKKNFDTAENLYLISAKLGDIDGQFNVAFLYHRIKKNFEKAEYWYLQLVNQNCNFAKYNLGFLYENFKKDYQKAEYWYLNDANDGGLDSQYRLILLYHKIKEQSEYRMEKWLSIYDKNI